MEPNSTVTLDKIVSLCKRKGFVFQSAEIYGGLNGVYDFGPLGTLLKNNIKKAWTDSLKKLDQEIVFLDGAQLGSPAMWEASGHVSSFHDPLIECKSCHKRYRTDELEAGQACPSCGKNDWSEERQFHLMFKTQLGAAQDQASVAYLRPETAQTVFVNFKNVMTSSRTKIPFGIAQIGKAFRNEITPKQFLFRLREFEQMEMEWFCKEENAPQYFDFWLDERKKFYKQIGIDTNNIQIRNHDKEELAHYAKATADVEYKFPFGWKELEGIAYRGDYDLRQHTQHSGKDLAVFDDTTKQSYTPHVVECSVGVDRLFLTLLFEAYTEEVVDKEKNDTRIVLKFAPAIAPIKVAFLPLAKKLAEPAKEIYKQFKNSGLSVQFDVTGSIGKRYRRQDEIGTPLCVTYDFDSQEDGCVTVRHRDSMKQERISIDKLSSYINAELTQ